MFAVNQIEWRRYAGLAIPAIAVGLTVYLLGRTLAPFLPALCWAFALAVIGDPIYRRLLSAGMNRELAALAVIALTVVVVIGPAILVGTALARELTDVLHEASIDLPQEVSRIATSAMGLVSQTISQLIGGSVWLVSQIAVALFTLFFFLRDGPRMLARTRELLPSLNNPTVDKVTERIALMLRVSLAGKLLLGGMQGALGGLMFWWLGLPAPVFWGSVMAFLSIFPVIGAFVVWAPVAAYLALHGDWKSGLVLTAWGVLIIHPVDNLLGPVVVGTALHIHTLFMFFAIIGGMAAFGASGIVIGPVAIAALTSLIEAAERYEDA